MTGEIYGYDALSRLTNHGLLFQRGTTDNLGTSFAYNPASQIVSETGNNDVFSYQSATNADRSYAVNGLNQYTTAGPATFGYDRNGNLISDGRTSYAYDAENRLLSAGYGTMQYDPLGRLWQDEPRHSTIRLKRAAVLAVRGPSQGARHDRRRD